jgi:hypothetical protein
MNKLRKLSAAITLLFVLSLSTRAGEITTWVVAPTPPPPSPSMTATAAGEMTTWGAQQTPDSEPLLAEITLSIFQLLTVF